MKKLTKIERVEVMALFGYKMTPCQPLSYRTADGEQIGIDEVLRATVRFSGNACIHCFDVRDIDGRQVLLEFNSITLAWHVVTEE